jgi:anti-anti-sigma factor
MRNFSEVITVHEFALPHFRTDHVNGVTVFRILVKEICDPDGAVAVFRGVSAVARGMATALILIDLSRTKHMAGTALVVLSDLTQQVVATGGRLALCCLGPTLRVGADIMGLSSGMDIYDDEASALASF